MAEQSSTSFVYICNDLSYFIAHRLHLMQHLQKIGLEVHVIADPGVLKPDVFPDNFHPISLVRRKLSIKRDVIACYNIWKIINNQRAEMIHAITIKPIIFVGLILLVRNILRKKSCPCVFTYPGLGEVFRVVYSESPRVSFKRKLRRSIILKIYNLIAQLPNIYMTFENTYDCGFAVRKFNVAAHKAFVVNGAGINLNDFLLTGTKQTTTPIKILFAARLLRTKGIFDFIDAVKIIRENGLKFEALVAGIPDEGNIETISKAEIEAISRTGIITYLGFVTDMPHLLKVCDIVVLPTYYREGLPRVLIEAAAAGCALLAYNAPGIQDILHDCINGKIIETGNIEQLSTEISYLINAPEHLRNMQNESVRIVQNGKFSEEDVQAQFLNIYETAKMN